MTGPIVNEPGDDVAVRVLVTGEETYGRLAIIEQHVWREAPSPRHLHANEDEIVYVLAGHLTFNLCGVPLDAPAGSCVVLPRNVEHSYRVVSEEARLLVIVTPAGLEGYFREVGAPGPIDIERLVTTAACYGVTITGPPV
jgi:quercetin dioxygenase-like cupin family protein